MTFRVELDELKRVLILHPVMTLSKVDNNVLGTQFFCKAIQNTTIKLFELLRRAQGRIACVKFFECLHNGFGREYRLQVCFLIPWKDLLVDSFVQISYTDTVKDLLRFCKSLYSQLIRMNVYIVVW